VQIERYRGTGFRVNADLDAASVRRHAAPSPEGKRLLGRAIETLGLSARAHDRILKVARTLADLAGEQSVGEERIAEAIAYRSLDRPAVTRA
jgi:magnesium chelatase family protein